MSFTALNQFLNKFYNFYGFYSIYQKCIYICRMIADQYNGLLLINIMQGAGLVAY